MDKERHSSRVIADEGQIRYGLQLAPTLWLFASRSTYSYIHSKFQLISESTGYSLVAEFPWQDCALFSFSQGVSNLLHLILVSELSTSRAAHDPLSMEDDFEKTIPGASTVISAAFYGYYSSHLCSRQLQLSPAVFTGQQIPWRIKFRRWVRTSFCYVPGTGGGRRQEDGRELEGGC